ncbi:peptidase C1, partial [Klebsiella pneumoniae]|nr:peptidase C1 [Klebsiella pneumoniae]
NTYSNPASIQAEIVATGPIEAAFTVYQDFMSYTSGVYIHTWGSQLGGHAVKMLGWGVSGSQNYWICANSWNTNWGMQGFFWIG